MSKSNRIVILGIDGMDPDVFLFMHSRGKMPVLGALADSGNFKPLATSNPPQSPVSWTNIATGNNSCSHGIFDFIHRNPKTYLPELSLFGIRPYRGGVKYTSHIRLPSVFEQAMQNNIPVTLLRWPLTFPAPESVPSHCRVLSGMGVPDMLGTLGRYMFYTVDRTISEKNKHGRIIYISSRDGIAKAELYGPRYQGWRGMKEASVPITMEQISEGLKIILPDTTLQLKNGEWGPHVIITFSMGMMGKVKAVTRMVCIESESFPSLFVLPMQIYPKETTLPLTSPSTFGKDLWNNIGPYLTLGMPEDTNGLKDGLIPDNVFLKLCSDVFAERERMVNFLLANFEKGIFACVFDTLDRVQHMFWRDRGDSSVSDKTNEPTSVVADWYGQMDALVGRVTQHIGNETPLIVLSDHGFTALDTYVHLNSWLAQRGYMVFKDGAKESGPLFDKVDWNKTRAYAIGFNSIYLNIKGREGKGIIESAEIDNICLELAHQLMEWTEEGESPVKQVYNSRVLYTDRQINEGPDLIVGYQKGYRASKQTVLGEAPAGRLTEDNSELWCGDHCCDPSFVPGVLFWSNLHNAKIDIPDSVSGKDISLLIRKWIDTTNQ